MKYMFIDKGFNYPYKVLKGKWFLDDKSSLVPEDDMPIPTQRYIVPINMLFIGILVGQLGFI